MVHCSITSLALAGLAAYTSSVAADTPGTGVFFHIPGRSNTLDTRGSGSSSDTCFKGQAACDSQCIDASFQCCHVGQGQACEAGYHCYSQGCCRDGRQCSGPPKGCTATTKQCDIGCIPRDRVCCGYGDGSSCDSDTICLSSGLCGRQQSELGTSSDSAKGPNETPVSAGGGGGGGASPVATSARTNSQGPLETPTSGSRVVGSDVYSLSPVTSTDQSETGSRATPSSDEQSPSGKTKSTSSAASKTTGTDKGGAGVALQAPAILAGLLAVAAYII